MDSALLPPFLPYCNVLRIRRLLVTCGRLTTRSSRFSAFHVVVDYPLLVCFFVFPCRMLPRQAGMEHLTRILQAMAPVSLSTPVDFAASSSPPSTRIIARALYLADLAIQQWSSLREDPAVVALGIGALPLTLQAMGAFPESVDLQWKACVAS